MGVTHIDCFSGVGGICTGFHAAGINTLAAIECVKSCVDSYSANHKEVSIIHSDIRTVTARHLKRFVPDRGIDILSSGMPCETFSTAGNKSRSFYDYRQFLFREAIRTALIVNAKIIMFENVPAITTKRTAKNSGELIIDILERELEDAGYINHERFILNAADYGVPQRRNRLFILAVKDSKIKLKAPAPSHRKNITVSEAFTGLPDVIPNTKAESRHYISGESEYASLMRNNDFWNTGTGINDTLTYQTPMKHRAYTIERFKLLEQGESLRDLFIKYQGHEREVLQEKKVLPRKMFIKRNYRLKSDEPAPTVTSHCLDEFVHPLSNRALTVRECARLQSFPDFYDFAGGPFIVPHIDREIQDKYEQIGDAVPPLLAYAWGIKLMEILKELK